MLGQWVLTLPRGSGFTVQKFRLMVASYRLRSLAVSSLVVLLGALLLRTAGPRPASAQVETAEPPGARADSLNRFVRVYLDCNNCYSSYLRRNLTFVHYVRDRKQADVHLLGTTRSTGGGGTTSRLEFIGRGGSARSGTSSPTRRPRR